jgi:hypothetical protein
LFFIYKTLEFVDVTVRKLLLSKPSILRKSNGSFNRSLKVKMSDLVLESQSPSLYGVAPPISDEAMDAKRKALEILVAQPERDRLPVPNHLLQSSKNLFSLI